MTLKLSVNKSFWIGLFLIFIFLFASIVKADDGVCSYTFDEKEAKNIVMLYDQLNQCRGLATSEGYLVDEYNNKITLMESAQKNLDSAILNCEKASEALKRILEAQKIEAALRTEKCLRDVEAARPKLKDKATWFGTGGLFGLIIGALLL